MLVKWLLFIGTCLPLSPRQSVDLVTHVMGVPEISRSLKKICFRESRCRALGVHKGDAQLAYKDGWQSQVNMKHIDPKCQPYRKDQWATRGAFGLSAVSHWNHMPDCYQPEWFDVPLVSAYVATKAYMRKCYNQEKKSWCGKVKKHKRVRAEIGRLVLFENKMDVKYGIISNIENGTITLVSMDGIFKIPRTSKKIKKIFHHKPPKKKR